MSQFITGEMIACHECDHLHYYEAIPVGARASCQFCGNLLYRHVADSVDKTLALYLTALILFLIANTFPFLSLELGGRQVDNVLVSSGWAMYQYGMGELGLLIFFTSILFPFLVICAMLYLLLAIKLEKFPPFAGQVYRLVNALMPWSLVGVFLLGTLIAIVKLQDIANVIFGPAMFALAFLLLIYTSARASFDPALLWKLSKVKSVDRIAELDEDSVLVNCHTCGYLCDASHAFTHCPRCSSPIHHRKNNSLERTWALLLASAVLFIPANLYPVMTLIRFGLGEPSTILGGVMKLIEGGMWGLAMIVFVASIVVPMLKLCILAYLCLSVQMRSTWRPRDRTALYRVTEVVGAWSMVDIYLVGLLSALVSLGTLSTVRPGIGAIFFAAVVIMTMFAAQSFDPRLIWDNVRKKDQQA
ncbi:MAG: paraquat-inducible protein A [Gammaproteobacteria bacterium]